MVPYKIPKEDFVYQIVRDVVRKRGIIETQEELCERVDKRLKKYNRNFVISPKRVRRIAIKVPNIKIKVKTRKSPKIKNIKRCPACKGRLKKIYGVNLIDKEVHVGYACSKCNFSSDLKSLVPMKYVFIWDK
ncbi:MAG: hypothetical protein GF368_04860 [Candidatus Aenigmarchaeota archaeon]|nr:hypothetical protein [Candidatus Aenigmarchaeota archaeon]